MSDKATFTAALRNFAAEGGTELWDPTYERKGYKHYRGERALALGLARYFDDHAPDYLGLSWYGYLHKHLVEAFVEFRTHDKWATLRGAYRVETGGDEIPDLVDVHIGGLHRMLMVRAVARLCTVLSGEKWLLDKLEAYFNAQQYCIDHAWQRFVRVGYRQIMPHIKQERHRGNSGRFGATTLMTYDVHVPARRRLWPIDIVRGRLVGHVRRALGYERAGIPVRGVRCDDRRSLRQLGPEEDGPGRRERTGWTGPMIDLGSQLEHAVHEARRIRRYLVRLRRNTHLMGDCGMASLLLADAIGALASLRGTMNGRSDHIWNEIDGCIIDITATQFGAISGVLVTRQPRSYHRPVRFRGRRVIDFFMTFYAEEGDRGDRRLLAAMKRLTDSARVGDRHG